MKALNEKLFWRCHVCSKTGLSKDEMGTQRRCRDCFENKTCRICSERKPVSAFGQLMGKVCKVCAPAYNKARAQRLYGEKRGVILERSKEWKQANAPKYRSQQRSYRNAKRAELKAAVLAHYGGACACCGEREPMFLTIDHINDDGAEQRKRLGLIDTWKWVHNNNYPAGYQMLCYNCNAGRYRNGGVCPHVERRAVAGRAS